MGPNDYGQNYDIADATNRMVALIENIATNRPFAKIIVANLLLRTDNSTINTEIQTGFNPFLPGICAAEQALGRQVYFDDLRSAVPASGLGVQMACIPTKPVTTKWRRIGSA